MKISLVALKMAMQKCLMMLTIASGLLGGQASASVVGIPGGWYRFDEDDEHIRLWIGNTLDNPQYRVCDENGKNCHSSAPGFATYEGLLIIESRFNNHQRTQMGHAFFTYRRDGWKGTFTAGGLSLTLTLLPEYLTSKMNMSLDYATPYGGGHYGNYTLWLSPMDPELDTDRCGGDYRSFDLEGGTSPWTCETACARDERCRAFTYVPAGIQGQWARCWLKDSVPGPSPAPGMVSGVKARKIPLP